MDRCKSRDTAWTQALGFIVSCLCPSLETASSTRCTWCDGCWYSHMRHVVICLDPSSYFFTVLMRAKAFVELWSASFFSFKVKDDGASNNGVSCIGCVGGVAGTLSLLMLFRYTRIGLCCVVDSEYQVIRCEIQKQEYCERNMITYDDMMM